MSESPVQQGGVEYFDRIWHHVYRQLNGLDGDVLPFAGSSAPQVLMSSRMLRRSSACSSSMLKMSSSMRRVVESLVPSHSMISL